jgi:hypothetical protein
VKVKIQAGAEIDTLTKDELTQALRDWSVEVMRGPIPKRFSAQGTVAGNALTIDGQNGSGVLGPEAGMVWLVTRVAVTGLTNATDPTSLFVNGTQPWNLVIPSVTGVTGSTGYHEFPASQVMLTGNDRLILASTGAIAATGMITLAGQAWELPVGLLWKLLG